MSKQILSGQQVLLKLREMIISGEFVDAKHIAEIPTAKMLGVSRQPVRIAFQLLEQEGLLIKNPTRGYRAREISPDLIQHALEVRGVLEGLAAKTLAEKGMSELQQQTLLNCIQVCEELFSRQQFGEQELEQYDKFNIIFHDTIIQGSENIALIQALIKNNQMPMASAKALTYDSKHALSEYRRLHFAHLQHCSIYDALLHRQAGRAETLMREHSRVVAFTTTMQKILQNKT
ncbi:GntR family transcriptional regulator [Acinetobacter puyangensis]|uniref:Transcriptional regulator, GntR family n=1 Tax=Acinetobacter puyangensis TaxID=1096779 RepID=A0A240E4F5_9GAMM|nr:transcriptional regulator, GntR family [Acinetobacter puyangensis]